jgi:methyl-accepting chemotaxis protein
MRTAIERPSRAFRLSGKSRRASVIVAGALVPLTLRRLGLDPAQSSSIVLTTVTDVAEQSNLLALNATIEAAEAGSEGNRFSVVASEMKNLADQAKTCTVQVRTILIEIQKGINCAVMLTEEAVKRVELGKQQAEVSEESILQMSETTKQSVQAFQQIIAATNQQQVGFDQVTQGMKDIDQATQQTAAGTSQLEQAVLSLSSLSQQLKTAVAMYRV